MAYFLFEAIYMTVPYIWVIFILVFFLEFISDYTALNIYYKFSNETPPQYQVFGICSISIGLTSGVILAAGLVIPIHTIICDMPPPLWIQRVEFYKNNHQMAQVLFPCDEKLEIEIVKLIIIATFKTYISLYDC